MSEQANEFEFACPHCGQTLLAEQGWAGMELSCPTCGKGLTVPHVACSVKCPYCGTEYEADESEDGTTCQCSVCNKDFTVHKVQVVENAAEPVLTSAGSFQMSNKAKASRKASIRKVRSRVLLIASTLLITGLLVALFFNVPKNSNIVLPKWDDVVTWLRREAEQGNTDAQFTVGTIIFSRVRSEGRSSPYLTPTEVIMCRRFRSIDESRKEIEKIEDAISWYRMAAQKEDLAAITCMGVCYYWLARCTIDGEIKISTDRTENIIAGKRYGFEARKYLELAALGGNYPDALYNLAYSIYTYNCSELDEIWGGAIANRDNARDLLLHRAAEQGHTPSQLSLAFHKKDQSAADAYYEEAKKSSLAYAKGNCAFYEFSRQFGYSGVTSSKIADVESVCSTRNKADAGDARAQYAIGKCYLEGSKREERTKLKEDHAEAVRWFRKAADQGLPVAQCKLGLCYYNGDGLKQDVSEAFKWFYKAAHQGNKDAQKYLGICYYAGLGVERNSQTAIKWLRKGVTRKSSCLLDFYQSWDENE